MTQSPPTGELVARIREACNGHPHAKIAWPHRILHEAADAITTLERELDEARANKDDGLAWDALAKCKEVLAAERKKRGHLEEALRIAEAVLRNADGFETTDDGRIPLHSPFTAAKLARAALQVEESKG